MCSLNYTIVRYLQNSDLATSCVRAALTAATVVYHVINIIMMHVYPFWLHLLTSFSKELHRAIDMYRGHSYSNIKTCNKLVSFTAKMFVYICTELAGISYNSLYHTQESMHICMKKQLNSGYLHYFLEERKSLCSFFLSHKHEANTILLLQDTSHVKKLKWYWLVKST